jgi:Big-like domain-containing protein
MTIFRTSAAGVLLIFAACARMGSPPGGPEDIEPPRVAEVAPHSDSARVPLKPELVVAFSEKVQKEQAQLLVQLSPDPGRLYFNWDGPRLSITVKDSLRPDVTYRLRVRPGVTDMHRVKADSSFVSYFSTGSEFDAGEIAGTVTHADSGVFGAVIRAAWMKDTTLVYDTYTDSSGAYRLPYLRGGGYHLLAFADANRNGSFDYTREPGAEGTTSVIFEPAKVDFTIETADTTAPLFRSAEAADSLTVRLVFDDPLDTLQTFMPDSFSLRSPDSSGTALAVDSVSLDKADIKRILLFPAEKLVEGQNYHVTAGSVKNRAGLILKSASRSFTFKAAKPARTSGAKTGGRQR